MKKALLILCILFARVNVSAQALYNGDFSINSCTTLSACTYGYFAGSPCMANWIAVSGSPLLYSAGGVYMQSAFTDNPTPTTSQDFGPGSTAIAANYPFIKGGCYTITLNLNQAENLCTSVSNTFEVWAANGLSQPGAPACIGPHPPTPSTFEQIGIKTFGPQSSYSGGLSFNYTATKDNNQLLIFVNQNTQCRLPGSHPPGTNDGFVGLTVNLQKVSVSFTPCGPCVNNVLTVSNSSQLSAGDIIEHSGIIAGGSPTVSPPTNKNTILAGGFVLLNPDFSVVVDNQHFFEIIPASVCQCILESPIVFESGDDKNNLLNASGATGSLQMYLTSTLGLGEIPGGVWSSDNNGVATVDNNGVVTSNTSGLVHITYTLNGCSTTITITVLSQTPPQRPANTSDSTSLPPFTIPHGISVSNNAAQNSQVTTSVGSVAKNNQSISVYPNPTQNSITISYPCNANGQLNINITDVDGKAVYTESVSCDEGMNVQHNVDVSALVPGVYFIDLTINEQHVVKKFVKM